MLPGSADEAKPTKEDTATEKWGQSPDRVYFITYSLYIIYFILKENRIKNKECY